MAVEERPQIRGIYSGADAAISVAGFARNNSYVLTFKHAPTGHTVSFPSIITEFSDTHTPGTSQKTFAGVPDPLITQAGTTRDVSLTFKVVSASLEEARYNTQSVNMLLQMMYPRISPTTGKNIGKPFIFISGFSMLNDTATIRSTKCLIQNINYSLDVDEGFIMSKDTAEGELHPISITINISARAVLPIDLDADAIQPYPADYPRYR